MRIIGPWVPLRGLGTPERSPAFGAVLLLAGCALLTVNDALMKSLVSDLPVGQVVSLRGFAGLILAILAAPLVGGFDQLRPRNPRNVGILTGLLVINLFLFPFSLRFIPLADAILLAYMSPIVVAALSPWLLAEHVGWRRWSAVALGLIGAALVINPEGGSLHPAVLAPIIVAIIVGLRDILTRRYIIGESALALIAAANLAAGVVGLATAPFGWVAPTPSHWIQIISAAALLTTSQFMIAGSFRYADAAVISCLKYSSIIWAALLGWFIWGEALSLGDWAGAALIALSGIVITLRSRKPVP
ncbi:MAG TPA: DMT family transporter [Thermohalobaculum sp.]|nr:DMT family transporter [Thermohalobaculum sp.]